MTFAAVEAECVPLRSVELFAGGGGMALGMHGAGFEHEALVEIDTRACAVLRRNAEFRPELWKVDAVQEIDVRSWLKQVPKDDLTNIDLIAGGPPCQPFSIAGARAGHNDDRNMFPAAIETVGMLRPKIVVFENVPGLLQPQFIAYYDYLRAWLARPHIRPYGEETWAEHYGRLLKSRSGSAYHVYREVIHAADFGVPQARTRVFLMAIRSDILGARTWPGVVTSHSRESLLWDQWVSGAYWSEHGLPIPASVPARCRTAVHAVRKRAERPITERWQTVRDLLSGLPQPVDGLQSADYIDHIGIPGARSYKGHNGSPIDSPAKTIKAGVHGVCGGEAMIRFADGSLRYMTVRECARAQTFPDDYVFELPRSRAMRYIGNAVAVSVARAIGQQLCDHTGLRAPV